MTTDVKAHMDHDLLYNELVSQDWTVNRNEQGDLELGERLIYDSEVKENSLYCKTCDLYLEDWQL